VRELRSTVSMLLPSKAQFGLFWGPEFNVLYNDAYRPVFGAKHPGARGRPGREAWSEIWSHQLLGLLEGVGQKERTSMASPRHAARPFTGPQYVAVRSRGAAARSSADCRFTAHHERIAVGIASWAAVALENARLYMNVQPSSSRRSRRSRKALS
jgi:GAF domain-containing protein